ncbi:MAG: sulfatase-like hydrolase/transferase, partial [Alphaproteobacteria bacterium]
EGPDGFYDEKRSPYNEYLKSKGYPAENPWSENANAGVDDKGGVASGWMFKNADKPANIHENDSETPWLTQKTIEFIEQANRPWCAHVSYIKPHWPYIVPAPYHNMFSVAQVPPAKRHAAERDDPHPVFGAYMENKIATAFQQDEVREKVIPAYMGLIKQCDDQLGVLLAYLEKTDQMDSTMIVLTSDHGDYLGDHWLGEKDLFHEQSVKVPMIIYDPRSAADNTRGTTCDALVESIDLAATFVDLTGKEVPDHILEGRSLLPWLEGQVPNWRKYAISEYDYSSTPQCVKLGLEPRDARLFMVFDGRFKLIHAEGGFRPMLFDLMNDPDEFFDLGRDEEQKTKLDELYGHLAKWGRRMSQRVTKSDQQIKDARGKSSRRGILPFLIDGSEVSDELTEKFRGKTQKSYLEE